MNENGLNLAQARIAPRLSNALALAGCVLLLLLLCADAATAQGANLTRPLKEETIDSLLTSAGTISIVRLGEQTDMRMELRLNGKKVYAIEESMNAGFVAQFRTYSSGELIVMSVNEGGSACPAQFQIIRVEDAGKVSVTKEFGDCGDSPAITLEMIPDEQVTLRFQGYYRLSQAGERGFKPPPPSAWLYKNGVLTELKTAPPKRRGK